MVQRPNIGAPIHSCRVPRIFAATAIVTLAIDFKQGRSMKMLSLAIASLVAFTLVSAQIDRTADRFNYDTTIVAENRIDFGPREWEKVRCEDRDTCVSIIASLQR